MSCFWKEPSLFEDYIWLAWVYSGLACLTCIVVCKNKNGICNQAELQTVANTRTEAGKGCSTRNRAKERALIMVLVMSAYEATLQ